MKTIPGIFFELSDNKIIFAVEMILEIITFELNINASVV
jgi:hypothetical protein